MADILLQPVFLWNIYG